MDLKYGAVYTPGPLSIFVAELLKNSVDNDDLNNIKVILDPASGGGSLLSAAETVFGESCTYIGVDIDREAVNSVKNRFIIYHDDAIMPQNIKKKPAEFWKGKLPTIDAIIANPPWSSEKIYDRVDLKNAGYNFISGQYDSYVLFIELAYKLLRQGGVMAFIVPDSLFDAQNEQLRKFLIEKSRLKVVARLGEKIFNGVNRATTVIVCQKNTPTDDSETKCFRLSTENRRSYLAGQGTLMSYFEKDCHTVKQSRFLKNAGYRFDIDTHQGEEQILRHIVSQKANLEQIFQFGRGVEISKAGALICCPRCNYAQGFKKTNLIEGSKKCSRCGQKILITDENIKKIITNEANEDSVPILVGENIRRYEITGQCYIKLGIEGINYKSFDLYNSNKLLVRKTGLGIYGAIDYAGRMTSQTVYILTYLDKTNQVPLEYYLAFINSRVVYYYYLKVYGENEWKSHPYLTKKILFDLPIKPFCGSQLDSQIIQLAKKNMSKYNYQRDLELEKLIMDKYNLSVKEKKLIVNEMNRLPNLSSVNNMKMEQ